MIKSITIVHLMDLVSYPPVISLVECLLNNDYRVNLVSYGVRRAPAEIIDNPNFNYKEMPVISGNNAIAKIRREIIRQKLSKQYTNEFMKNSDLLWTTTDISVRSLGDTCLKYQHVMQLMELEEWYPRIVGIKYFRFPIDYYARKAWKNVVPEIHRAHIEQTWWNLPSTPEILPNKPYKLEKQGQSSFIDDAIQILKNERRKIILYLGIISGDRDLDKFADAVQDTNDEYALYIAGRVSDEEKKDFNDMMQKYDCITYLGNFPAPTHLALLNYAYIGLTPYYIRKPHEFISPLNIQFCAPNKIFEYSGYGVPMIGTDVLGLKEPFEKYGIGVCCKDLSRKSIIEAIRKIDSMHVDMAERCKEFYLSVDYDKIVNSILKN